MRALSLEEKTGARAFAGLFEDRPGYPQRKDIKEMKDCYPTNPQAEVLVFEKIPERYICGCALEKEGTVRDGWSVIGASQVRAFGMFHEHKTWEDAELFKPREDWEAWKAWKK